VRALFSTGKLAQVLNEMKGFQLDILGVSEMRWTGSGKTENDGMTKYTQEEKNKKGVSIILSLEISRAVITVRLQTRYTKVSLIQVYEPTNTVDDED